MHRPSRQLHPFKVITLILYGTYDHVKWLDRDRVHIRIGPMARLMHVTNDRLKEYLSELQRMRYVSGLTLGYGFAEMKVRLPPERQPISEAAA